MKEVDDQLIFDWNDEAQLKENLKIWAYNDDLILIDQDEDLLFHDIRWTSFVFDYIFDESCVKREYIVNNLSEFIRQIFLNRMGNEIEQVEFLFIKKMKMYNSFKKDKSIEECIEYFFECKRIYDHPKQADFEQTKAIGKLLLNGLTNISKINGPTITSSGDYQITSTSSVTCHLCVDKDKGNYKYNHYTPCE